MIFSSPIIHCNCVFDSLENVNLVFEKKREQSLRRARMLRVNLYGYIVTKSHVTLTSGSRTESHPPFPSRDRDSAAASLRRRRRAW